MLKFYEADIVEYNNEYLEIEADMFKNGDKDHSLADDVEEIFLKNKNAKNY